MGEMPHSSRFSGLDAFVPVVRAAPIGSAGRRDRLIIAGAILCVFALQAQLVVTKSINWDEFFFFSRLLEFQDGRMASTLQTSYARLFGFLLSLPGDSVDQLLVGRAIMLACELIAALALYGIAARFGSRKAAILCALTYVTAGAVFLHGFAFRADPLATALLMGALWAFVDARMDWKRAALVALLLALAMMVTIKTVFYAPAFLGIAWWKWRTRTSNAPIARLLVLTVCLAALLFAALASLHSAGLAPPLPGPRQGSLRSAWETVFSAGFVPQPLFLVQQILRAPHVVILLCAAPWLWRREWPADVRIAMAGLLLPLATLLFYRNSYPYYFVFVLAPALVTIAPAIDLLIRRYGAALYASLLVALAGVLTLAEPRAMLPAQRALVDGVHQIFPRPVAYFDFSGVIGDFPRPLSFMTSGWGLQRYRLRGEPLLATVMAKRPVPLLLVNHPVLGDAVAGGSYPEQLLPEDARALRENFIPHWGPVWVAGKRIPAGVSAGSVQVAVPGLYTVEQAPIVLAGRMLAPGETVRLDRRIYQIRPHSTREARLRWGDRLRVPKHAAPAGYLFTEY